MSSFKGLTLQSSQAVSNAKRLGWPLTELGGALYLAEAPGGYRFYLVDKEQPPNGEFRLTLCTELNRMMEILNNNNNNKYQPTQIWGILKRGTLRGTTFREEELDSSVTKVG